MKKNKYLFLLIIPFSLLIFMKNPNDNPKIAFTHNPELKTIDGLKDWKGTPVDDQGNFRNLYNPFSSSFKDLLKWKLGTNPQKHEKKAEERTLQVDFDPDIFHSKEDYLIWLGHASFLIRINGTTLLTDPVLMDNIFLKRKSELPFSIEDMPALDYVLLSHNHRDHCDKNTLTYLAENNPKMEILTGLGMEEIISPWLNGQEITAAGWFQSYNINRKNLKITYIPSRHWSRRGLKDENASLWGGFYIQSPDQSIYFMGDSGYGPHFTDIANALGAPDYCLMGVGAYKPIWFMHPVHISPEDAIQAFNELGGSYFIPMHFGTFDLSDEPRMEPWDVLETNRSNIKGELIEPYLGKNLLQ